MMSNDISHYHLHSKPILNRSRKNTKLSSAKDANGIEGLSRNKVVLSTIIHSYDDYSINGN